MNRCGMITAALARLFGILPGRHREPEGKYPPFGTEPPVPDMPVFRLAASPLLNPSKLLRAYRSLVDDLKKG